MPTASSVAAARHRQRTHTVTVKEVSNGDFDS